MRTLVSGIAVTGITLGGLSLAPSGVGASEGVIIGAANHGIMAAVEYATEKRVFARNGLNVSGIEYFPAPVEGLEALAAGEFQFMYVPAVTAIDAYVNKGMNIRIVAPASGTSAEEIAQAKKNPTLAATLDDAGFCATPGMTRWRDLGGKTVGVPERNGQAEVTIAAAVLADGGDPGTITWKVTPLKDVVALIQSGEIAGGLAIEPFIKQCTNAGLINLGSAPLKFFDNVETTRYWVTTAPYAEANPEAVLAFQKSMYQVHKFANKSEANMTTVLKGETETVAPTYLLKVKRKEVENISAKLLALGFIKQPVDVPGLLMRQYAPSS
jgi:ABC-type nitrate/sulfonate/bicarbonate transport system substrate-binding protein